MSVVAVETFFGILALVGMVLVGGAALLRLAAVGSVSARRAYERVVAAVGPSAYGLAWFVALLATTGSLYFSEVAGFEPCRLCWYQRIAMYPLVAIIAVAIVRRDPRPYLYVLPLSLAGLAIALYHNLLYFGVIPEGVSACRSGVSCTTRFFEWFGFITIPFLSLTAFSVISVLMLVHWRTQPDA